MNKDHFKSLTLESPLYMDRGRERSYYTREETLYKVMPLFMRGHGRYLEGTLLIDSKQRPQLGEWYYTDFKCRREGWEVTSPLRLLLLYGVDALGTINYALSKMKEDLERIELLHVGRGATTTYENGIWGVPNSRRETTHSGPKFIVKIQNILLSILVTPYGVYRHDEGFSDIKQRQEYRRNRVYDLCENEDYDDYRAGRYYEQEKYDICYWRKRGQICSIAFFEELTKLELIPQIITWLGKEEEEVR